jgi:hypothetical protein
MSAPRSRATSSASSMSTPRLPTARSRCDPAKTDAKPAPADRSSARAPATVEAGEENRHERRVAAATSAASSTPLAINPAASPAASALAVHAVEIEYAGPRSPSAIATSDGSVRGIAAAPSDAHG